MAGKIPVRNHPKPLVPGWWWGIYDASHASRSPEDTALDRIRGREKPEATNNAVYDPDSLLCSICGKRKHYEEFSAARAYTWRRGRRYECKVCEKLQRVDQVGRRAKRLARSKTK